MPPFVNQPTYFTKPRFLWVKSESPPFFLGGGGEGGGFLKIQIPLYKGEEFQLLTRLLITSNHYFYFLMGLNYHLSFFVDISLTSDDNTDLIFIFMPSGYV